MQNKKVLLLILDGLGFSEKKVGNAVALANPHHFNSLLQKYPHELIEASGEYVGLPKGQPGNSEVGHLSLGAGRIVYTGLPLINKSIENGEFFKNKAFLEAIQYTIKNNSHLHIMGLISDGGVHSCFNHIISLFQVCKEKKIEPILHIFSDGRDVDQKAFLNDCDKLLDACKEYKVTIGSISGRYYAMDRDQRWERIQKTLNAITCNGTKTFKDLKQYVHDSYSKNVYDEFISPAYNASVNKESISLQNKDAVIFANYRPDRARELTHILTNSTYYQYRSSKKFDDLFVVSMTKYEGIPTNAIAFELPTLDNVLGKVLEINELSQLRASETEKYAHITFFFDGGKEVDFRNETKILVPSPKVSTYDLEPVMSANEITDKVIPTIGKYDFTLINYANADMVGHTGNLPATIQAIKTVDVQIGRLYEKCSEKKVTMFILADHGNAEEMLTDDNKPITKHTTNPVWFILTDKKYTINMNGTLSNIAPSILKYMNIKIPLEMDQKPIIKKNRDV